MTKKQKIRWLVGKIGQDPELIDELLKQPNGDRGKKILVERGILEAKEPGLKKDEVRKEILKLLKTTDDTTPPSSPPAQGERWVEWVAAIGTAAAGAAAAACTADT